jgi:hypothetical protein
VPLRDARELHSGFAHRGRVNRFAATTAAAMRTSATPPRCGASRSTLELADQEGV